MRNKIDGEIFRLAIPNMLSNVSVPLLSSVDTALMGHLSSAHLGAIGISGMIFNFIFWNFGFLRMGTTGAIAQAYGASDEEGIAAGFWRAIVIAIGISIVLIISSEWIGGVALDAIGTPIDQRGLVSTYFYIRLWAAPATLGLYVILGWLFGMQNSIYPLMITVGLNLFNIIISYLLVYHLGWGIAGAAWGTVSAEYLGVVIACLLLYGKYRRQLSSQFSTLFESVTAWRALLTVNRDLFFRTILLTLAFALLYRFSANSGVIMLAITVVLLQFLSWLSYVIDGLAYSTESLIGKYAGMSDIASVHEVMTKSFRYGGLFAGCFALVFYGFGSHIADLFTDDDNILIWFSDHDSWLFMIPIICYFSYIWDGIFIGYLASRAMLLTMLGAFLVFLTSLYLFTGIFHNYIWLSFMLFMGSRALFQWFYWNKYQSPMLF